MDGGNCYELLMKGEREGGGRKEGRREGRDLGQNEGGGDRGKASFDGYVHTHRCQ